MATPGRAKEKTVEKLPEDALEWQEFHSPTEAVEITISLATRRVKESCRRRKADARVWNAMSPDQELAAERILKGFLLCGGAIGCRTMPYNLSLTSGSMSSEEGFDTQYIQMQVEIANRYREWTLTAQKGKISVGDIVGYLSGLDTLNDLDKFNRVREGTARKNLFEGIDLYNKLFKKHIDTGR
jgi:hypothetical protein